MLVYRNVTSVVTIKMLGERCVGEEVLDVCDIRWQLLRVEVNIYQNMLSKGIKRTIKKH